MILKIIKYIGYVLLVYTIICLSTPFNTTLRNRSIKNQINHLSGLLDNGYDDQLQNRFPEGKIFSNALLALSTIEFCENNDIAGAKYSQVVDNCINRIQSQKARAIFDPSMEPKYGMFYNGWCNLVYSTYKKSKLFNYSAIKEKVNKEATIIESRLYQTLSDSLRVINSYSGMNWPADNLIGILSISNDTLKQKWLNHILQSTQHQSGLIHHAGHEKSTIRGSSSAMITYCLSELEYEEVQHYNKKFTTYFVDHYLGIQLVKENEDGSNHRDVDSGPVLFGYGAAATIMNIKTQASLGHWDSKLTWAVMNLISIPINIFNKKYYLMNQEPMFDLFMLWGSAEYH